jgi:hypothetical protein
MSALGFETIVFDVVDCKVYPLLTDAVGASPTYGAAVDVPGISQVSLNPSITSAELKGDARIIAVRGRLEKMEFQATYGKLSLAVLDTILGTSVVTAAGTTPNRSQTFTVGSPASSPYFRLEFQITDLDAGMGSLNVVLYKCTLTGGTLFQSQTDQFGQPSFQASAFALDGTALSVANLIASLKLNETAAPLSA